MAKDKRYASHVQMTERTKKNVMAIQEMNETTAMGGTTYVSIVQQAIARELERVRKEHAKYLRERLERHGE